MNKQDIIDKLKAHQQEVKRFGVSSLFLFGSAVRDETNVESDIDLLIDFEPDCSIGLFDLARLQRLLQESLGCRVDLVTRDALHPALKDKILSEALHVA